MSDVKRFDLEQDWGASIDSPFRFQETNQGRYVKYEDYEILDERFRAMIKSSNDNYSDVCDLQAELKKLERTNTILILEGALQFKRANDLEEDLNSCRG